MARLMEESSEKRHWAEDALNFIEYAPLGRAILLAHPRDRIADFLPASERDGVVPAAGGVTKGRRVGHEGPPRRSVVLIDEIDKAPRDFTNDLLDELETMQFRVPEVRDAPTPALTDRTRRPVVIITSNSERQLPEAFMRRCLYFHIPFPERARAGAEATDQEARKYSIENIVAERLGPRYGANFSTTPLVTDALDIFYRMRELAPRLRKPPSTAELLNWLVAMREDGADSATPLNMQPEFPRRAIAALLKTDEDRQRGRTLLAAQLKK
jgi:MoxR-like ATPase